MVPMLNPDGVARGHYRCDSRGCNLNRFYDEPDTLAHPSIYAVKYFLKQNSANLRLYLDLHAHASKRGCFIYGNYLDSREEQIKNRMYAKLIAMNSPWFEYKGCDFSLKGMSGKDKRDNGLTKDGSGRVGIYKATGCSHCYTLECNYNEGLATNFIPVSEEIGSYFVQFGEEVEAPRWRGGEKGVRETFHSIRVLILFGLLPDRFKGTRTTSSFFSLSFSLR